MAQALDLLEQAIAREPRYGLALAVAATYRVDLENYDWADERDFDVERLRFVCACPHSGRRADRGRFG